MNLILGPQGPYSHARAALDAFPDWSPCHIIGSRGQFGLAWDYDSPDGMFQTRVGPDHWWNRGRWSRHERAVVEDVKAWAKVMEPKPGEPIVFNHEATHWRAFTTYPDGGTRAKSVKRRDEYLAAVYDRTARGAWPMLIGHDIGASGVFAQQWKHGEDGMLDPQWFHQNCTHSTLGLDFNAPQLYFKKGEMIEDSIKRFVQELMSAPQLDCIPIVSPFYERTFELVPESHMQQLFQLLRLFGVSTTIVWCNFDSIGNGHELDARIETHRPALDRLREVYGAGEKA